MNQAEKVFGHEVMSSDGNKIGKVENVWIDDATDELEFVAVKMGFIMGKSHIIPVADAQIENNTVTVPFGADQVKGTPSFGADEELSPDQEQEIYSYYGIQRSESNSPTGLLAGGTGQGSTEANQTRGSTGMAAQDDRAGLTLSEEELQVGKREVEAGRVRLRKVVHTEHKEVPVDLRREEVVVERVDSTTTSVPDDAFKEGMVEVPVMREEAVVSKEALVTGGVRLNTNTTTETETVRGDVRREEADVDNNVETETTARR